MPVKPNGSLVMRQWSFFGEFKKLLRLLQWKSNLKREHRGRLNVLQLLVRLHEMDKVSFHLIGTNGFHAKADKKFTAARSRRRLQNRKFEKNYVVVFQTTSKK